MYLFSDYQVNFKNYQKFEFGVLIPNVSLKDVKVINFHWRLIFPERTLSSVENDIVFTLSVLQNISSSCHLCSPPGIIQNHISTHRSTIDLKTSARWAEETVSSCKRCRPLQKWDGWTCSSIMDGYVKDLENIAPTNTKKGPTKVFLIPQQRSFNHIYLTFSLSNMIYAHLSKNCRESHLRTSMGQIAQDAWIGRW